MATVNPNLVFMSINAVQKNYFPMFTQKTVRKIVKENMATSFIGNKLLVRQSEVERYLSTIKDNNTTE